MASTFKKPCDYARWIVVKSVKVRNKDGEVTDILSFKKPCWEMDRKGKHTVIEFVGEDKRKHVGLVPSIALTDKPIIDYAFLLYENKMGRMIPVSNRCHGDVDGNIDADDRVSVIAVTGDWCLTNKGWTLMKFLRKFRGEFFEENGRDLCTNIILQAVKDYQIAIKRLREGKCKSKEDFQSTFSTIDSVEKFFKETEVRRAKFERMMKNLGVDEAWMKEKRRIYDSIKAREEEARFYKSMAKRKR